jgi:hypothetical protein
VTATPGISTIAAAIETALKTIDGLRTAPYLSDSLTPPVALVAFEDIEYHGAFSGGNVVHTFTVFLVVARADVRSGILAMESYASQAGPQSFRAALESDPSLGGVVSSAWVQKAGPPTAISINGAEYISLPFTVIAHA